MRFCCDCLPLHVHNVHTCISLFPSCRTSALLALAISKSLDGLQVADTCINEHENAECNVLRDTLTSVTNEVYTTPLITNAIHFLLSCHRTQTSYHLPPRNYGSLDIIRSWERIMATTSHSVADK